MKHIILLSIVLFSISNAFGQNKTINKPADSIINKIKALNDSRETKLVGKPLATFSGKSADTLFSNEQLKGKFVFVNFTNASYAGCIAEMKAMNRLYAKLKDSTKIEVVVFTYENDSVIAQMRKNSDAKYRIVQLSRAECDKLKAESGYPTKMLVDKKGIIRKMYCGNAVDEEFATQKVLGRVYPEFMEIVKQK